MKRIATFAIAALAFLTSFAQTRVKGLVLDSATNEPEIYSVIRFYSSADMNTPVVYTTTDENGAFNMNIKDNGNYVMVFENLGRKTVNMPFTVAGENELDLGSIQVEDDAELLEAGKVVALQNLVKMDVDKISYKVEEDIDSKSSTLLDMLRKVPMVTVDGSDNITVNGSSNFQVLVDGKPNVMMSSNPSQVFKSMPASFAKSIEVVTNPGVKYDAEGVGGVLNITTNKAVTGGQSASLDGYNASVGVNVNNRGYTGRAFVSGQNGKLSYSANLNYMENTIDGNESWSMRQQLDAAGNVISTMESTSSSQMKSPSKMGSISLGYEIDELRLVSASVGLTQFASNNTSLNQTTINTLGNSFTYGSQTESIWDSNSITGSLDYQRSFKNNPDQILTLSYQFNSSPSVTDSKSIFDAGDSFLDFTDRYTDGSTNTLQNTLQLDYATRLSQALTMNTGVKYINRLNKSDQTLYLDNGGSWAADENGSMIYRHNNNIVAAYGEVSFAKNNLSGKAGVRYEHTLLGVEYKLGNGSDFSLDYGNLVPAASLQYNIGMNQNIGLTYNMRISRPGITYLNPYVDVSDPTAKKYGNSNLEPERAHNISLVYNYMSQKFIVNSTLRYTYSGNSISGYSFYDADGLLNTTYGNNTVKQNAGLSTMLMWNASSSTRLVLNGGLNYMDMGSSSLGLSNDGWSGNVMLNLQQTLPYDIRFSGNLIWSSANKTLDGSSSGMTMLMAGLTKTFLDDKLSVGVNYMGPATLSTTMEMESHSAGKDYINDSVNKINMGSVVLNVSYSFGNNSRANVKKTRKTIANEDVMDMSSEGQQMNSMMGM
ncbi:MAG: TonB-dependent receptor [Bacteroidales bacterium]|nr:TonB-dependent receptor [Bacteroidales bacterium]